QPRRQRVPRLQGTESAGVWLLRVRQGRRWRGCRRPDRGRRHRALGGPRKRAGPGCRDHARRGSGVGVSQALSTMKPTLLLSDLHLAPERIAAAAAFHAFARGPARDAAAVYVMGDLFDAWIGDDQRREPFAGAIVESLRGISDAGVPVYVARGNRDFLLGADFARDAGATLLDEQTIVDVAGAPTLLTHGDEFCTDDVGYQRFRTWSRDPRSQRRLLHLPYPVRRLIAAWLRRGSRAATARKPESILDVNA